MGMYKTALKKKANPYWFGPRPDLSKPPPTPDYSNVGLSPELRDLKARQAKAEEERKLYEARQKNAEVFRQAGERAARATARRGNAPLSNAEDQRQREAFIKELTGIDMSRHRNLKLMADRMQELGAHTLGPHGRGSRDLSGIDTEQLRTRYNEYLANNQKLLDYGFTIDGMPKSVDAWTPKERVAMSYMLGTHPESIDQMGAIEPYSKEFHQAYYGSRKALEHLGRRSGLNPDDREMPILDAFQRYSKQHGRNALSIEHAAKNGNVQDWAGYMVARNRHMFGLDAETAYNRAAHTGYGFLNGLAFGVPDLATYMATFGQRKDLKHLMTGKSTEETINEIAAAQDGLYGNVMFTGEFNEDGSPVYGRVNDGNPHAVEWTRNLAANAAGAAPLLAFSPPNLNSLWNAGKGFISKGTGAIKGVKNVSKFGWNQLRNLPATAGKIINTMSHPIQSAKQGLQTVGSVATHAADTFNDARRIARARHTHAPSWMIGASAVIDDALQGYKAAHPNSILRMGLLNAGSDAMNLKKFEGARQKAFGGKVFNAVRSSANNSDNPYSQMAGTAMNEANALSNATSFGPQYWLGHVSGQNATNLYNSTRNVLGGDNTGNANSPYTTQSIPGYLRAMPGTIARGAQKPTPQPPPQPTPSWTPTPEYGLSWARQNQHTSGQ